MEDLFKKNYNKRIETMDVMWLANTLHRKGYSRQQLGTSWTIDDITDSKDGWLKDWIEWTHAKTQVMEGQGTSNLTWQQMCSLALVKIYKNGIMGQLTHFSFAWQDIHMYEETCLIPMSSLLLLIYLLIYLLIWKLPMPSLLMLTYNRTQIEFIFAIRTNISW